MNVDRSAPVWASAGARIRAPRERVWDVLAEVERWPEWNPDVAKVRLQGPIEPGTRFRWKAGGLPIVSELREVDRPASLGWTGRSLGLRTMHVWRFAEQEDATFVTTEESFDGWLARLLSGYLGRMLRRSLQRGADALRRECEHGEG